MLIMVFTVWKFSFQLIVFSVIISTLSAKDQLKDIAVDVVWPEAPTNRIKTRDVVKGNLNSILFIDDYCPKGMNCIEESMTRAVDKVLSMLATRVAETGSIGYESIQKSEIKQQKLQLKVDNSLYKLKDEENKEQLSDKIQNKNNRDSKKYNNTIEMEMTNLNPTENFNAAIESDEENEQDSEEKDSTTNSVEYIVFGGNKIISVR